MSARDQLLAVARDRDARTGDLLAAALRYAASIVQQVPDANALTTWQLVQGFLEVAAKGVELP